MGSTTEPKKLFFRGALSFPVQIDGGGVADPPFYDPALLEGYFANNERGLGGWYPLGGGQTWHNGVHLHTGTVGRKVYAMAAGTIVAARLGENEAVDPARFPFGSPRFVLIRHQLSLIDDPVQRRAWDSDTWKTRDVAFYSLYMHVDTTSSKSEDVPWLKTYRDSIHHDGNISGSVWRLKRPAPGEIAWLSEEPKTKDGKLVAEPKPVLRLSGGERLEVLPGPSIAAKRAGHTREYAKVKELRSGKHGWVRTDGGRTEDDATGLKELQNGGVAVLKNLTVEAGECIGHTGPLQPEGGRPGASQFGVHVEVFSAKPIVPEGEKDWPLLEDTSGPDVICDVKTLLEQLKGKGPAWLEWIKGWFDAPPRLTRDQYTKVMDRLGQERGQLRRSVTRNTSFWAVDWPRMGKDSTNDAWRRNFDITDATLNAAQGYSWWEDVKRAEDFPQDPLVYHYHPLELMRYLAERVPRAPVFFVTRKDGKGIGTDYVVSRPDHLDPLLRINGSGEPVLVYEHDRAPWTLGRVEFFEHGGGDRTVNGKKGFVGVGQAGSPKFYGALKGTPRSPSMPSLSLADENIWASLWNSEGGLDALNSYDNGYLSVSGIQKIAAVCSAKKVAGVIVYEVTPEGELGGALNFVKTQGAQGATLFRKYFLDFGLDVDATVIHGSGSTQSCPLRIDGKTLDAGDVHKIRWLVYSYCAARALRDPEFNKLFYRYGLARIADVRAFTHKFGNETIRLDRLLRSQLAQAIVLDTHINNPWLAQKIWWEAAKKAGCNDSTAVDWSTITTAFEKTVVKHMIAARPHPTIYNGPQRSAFIVLCVKGIKDTAPPGSTPEQQQQAQVAANALAVSLGYASVQALKAVVGSNAASYMFNFLDPERPAT